MSGPYFRGFNRLDWCSLVVMQAAIDAQQPALAGQIADNFNLRNSYSFEPPLITAPPVWVFVTDQFVFIVSGSTTKPALQMVGNVLGSVAGPIDLAPGRAPAYFNAIAFQAWVNLGDRIKSDAAGRQVVLVGFSLGAAVVTLLKAILKTEGIASSCVTTGGPRTGDPVFAAAFDSNNFARLVMVNDPVPTFPPTTWAATGYHNLWTPYPPFVTYEHVGPGFSLSLPSNVVPGGDPMSLTDAILSIDIGIWAQWHNALLYARTLRYGLPNELNDGDEGFPDAGSFDDLAAKVFAYDPTGWPWGHHPTPEKEEFTGMVAQIAIYIRDVARPLGFKEIIYINGDPSSTSVQALINSRTAPLIQGRATFLSKSCEIYAARCSQVRTGLTPLVRSSALFKFTDNPLGGSVGVTEDIEACLVFDAWNVDRSSRRQFHFRGIDFTWITADQLVGPGQTAVAPGGLVDSYFQLLKNSGTVMLTGLSSSQHTFTQAAKTTQDSPIVLTIPTGGTFTPGQPALAEIRSCRQAPLLNGRWIVAPNPTDATLWTLVGSQNFSAPASAQGQIRAVNNAATGNITAVTFSDVSSKKTGRPDFLQRGRQSARVKHR